jgi:hypothetical protein
LQGEVKDFESMRAAVFNGALKDLQALFVSDEDPELEVQVKGMAMRDLLSHPVSNSLRVKALSSCTRASPTSFTLINIEIQLTLHAHPD